MCSACRQLQSQRKLHSASHFRRDKDDLGMKGKENTADVEKLKAFSGRRPLLNERCTSECDSSLLPDSTHFLPNNRSIPKVTTNPPILNRMVLDMNPECVYCHLIYG